MAYIDAEGNVLAGPPPARAAGGSGAAPRGAAPRGAPQPAAGAPPPPAAPAYRILGFPVTTRNLLILAFAYQAAGLKGAAAALAALHFFFSRGGGAFTGTANRLNS